jgi:hypothetical protein
MKALALALLVAGCTERTDLLPVRDMATACAPPGPPIQLDGEPCAAALAARLLRYAVCSCAPLMLPGSLFTQGSLPTRGSLAGPPAAVGTDGPLAIAGLVQVAGALEAAGAGGASFSRITAVLGNLRSGGPVTAARFLGVERDAFFAGDVAGRVDVRGIVHAAPGALIPPSVTAGGLVREPVMVPPPCGCDAPALDVAAAVAARATPHPGLAPDAFAAATGPASLDLGCGELYTKALETPAGIDLELRVHGRAALFVDGDVTLGGSLRVVLDPLAELDLVVAGNLTAQTGAIGAPQAASVRIWIGGSTVRLAAGVSLSAALYAPRAQLVADGSLIANGALFAQAFSVAGDLTVRFDTQLLTGGVSCGAPAQSFVQ